MHLRARALLLCLAAGPAVEARAQFTWECRTVGSAGVFVDDGTTRTVQLLPPDTLITSNEQRAYSVDGGSWMRTLLTGSYYQGGYYAQIFLQAYPRRALAMGTTSESAGARGPLKLALRVTGPPGRQGVLAVHCNGSNAAQGQLVMTGLGHRYASPVVPLHRPNSTSSFEDGASWLVQIPASGLLEAEIEADAYIAAGAPGFFSAFSIAFRPGPGCLAETYGYSWSTAPGGPLSSLSGGGMSSGGRTQLHLQHDWRPYTPGVLAIGFAPTRVPILPTINALLVVPIVTVPFVADASGSTKWTFSVAEINVLEVRAQALSLSSPEDFSNGLHLVCIR
jgi:hypothetical protein